VRSCSGRKWNDSSSKPRDPKVIAAAMNIDLANAHTALDHFAAKITFFVVGFDHGWVAHDRYGPDRDRLSGVAELSGAAPRHARWGGLTEAEKAAGAAELREIAGDRPDLLAQEAGLALGTSEGKRAEFEARGQAIAELCRMAGADEELIPQWVAEGKRRAATARMMPHSGRPRRFR
jgi:hypothetical protein